MSPARRLAALCCLLLVAAVAAGCGEATSSRRDGRDVAVAVSGQEPIIVPDVGGEDGDQAISEIQDASLTAAAEGEDGSSDPADGAGCTVTEQDPSAGLAVADGDAVTLTM